jgi:hypothetical protein
MESLVFASSPYELSFHQYDALPAGFDVQFAINIKTKDENLITQC